ncbi:MAG TPA: histidine phosphatase family protein [Streptomyces sp.]|nr:histidine phosphatase family protein [Streptomyces sp.]
MPTVFLVRHGRSTANTDGILAGRTPGVSLDAKGAAQAADLPGRLAGVPLAALVCSPLQRCRETLAPLTEERPGVPLHTEEGVSECDYGDWTGRKLSELAEEPLMGVVQQHPSAATFPGGESMPQMQQRSVRAVRDWDARIAREHGETACFLVCAHGDVIKSVLADALGMHLDLFQRIAVGPCSVSVIRYTPLRPFVLRVGETGELGSLVPAEDTPASGTSGGSGGRPGTGTDAAVGGGA